MTVAEAMSKPAITVQSDAPIDAAIERFADDNVGALPVVAADGKLVGMLSYLDVIQALRSR